MRIAALSVLVAVACAACLGGAASAPASRDGLLRGQVLVADVGNGNPARGGLIQAHPRPPDVRFRVSVRGVTVTGRRIARLVRTDARGRFRLRLPAGRYVLAGPLRSRASARVRTGGTASVLLTGTEYVTQTL